MNGNPSDVADRNSFSTSDIEFGKELELRNLKSPVPTDQGEWGWSVGRVVAASLVVAMLLFWVWAFSPLAPRGHPDELGDATFPRFAETRCAQALETMSDRVAPAFEAADLYDRANQITISTNILVGMVADLADRAPDPATRDGRLVRLWLADWDIYLGDRYAYADDFRAGRDAPFSVTAVNRDQVTGPIDSFANANGMASCVSPTDV